MEPHWHKGITLSTSTKINTPHFAYDQVIIKLIWRITDTEAFTLQNITKKFGMEISPKNISDEDIFRTRPSKM